LGSCHSTSAGKENVKGMPGDNLDLYAVMDLLKKSSSPEKFEKALNDKSNHINNLDLNGDGKVDYIRVIDNKEGDDHAFVLRVPLNAKESQDVAVIEMEKKGDKNVNIELTGDKDLYGPDYIIQPKNEPNTAGFLADVTVWVNVWDWPFVSYVYAPDYVVWASPFYWESYPAYWEPWEPVVYDVYYPEVEVYHPYFVEVREHHLPHAERIFYSHRVSSDFTYIRQENIKANGGREVPREGEEKSYNRNIPPSENKSFGRNERTEGKNSNAVNTPRENKSRENKSSPNINSNRDRTMGSEQRKASPNNNANKPASNRDFGKPNSSENRMSGKQAPNNGGARTMPPHNAPTPSPRPSNGGGNRKGGGRGGH